MSQDRDSIIEKAAKAMWDSPDEVEPVRNSAWADTPRNIQIGFRKGIEAAAVAAGWLPPKPAPTRGEAMAAKMVRPLKRVDVVGRIEIWHPTDPDRAIRLTDPSGGDAGASSLSEYIAAAIDHCVADALAAHTPAVDVARLEKIAEEFILTPSTRGTVSVGGMLFQSHSPEYVTGLLRKSLASLMRKSIEGGNSK